MKIACLVIALSEDRYKEVKQGYEKVEGSFPCIHIPGVLITDQQRRENTSEWVQNFGTKSMIGCFKAHQNAWKWLQESSEFEAAFIYEEDTRFNAWYKDCIVERLLPENDLVVFGNFALTNKQRQQNMISTYPLKRMIGNHGYAITKNGARFLLHSTKIINGHVDVTMSRLLSKFQSCVGICPNLVYQNMEWSSQSRVTKNPTSDRISLEYIWNLKLIRICNKEYTMQNIVSFLLFCSIVVVVFVKIKFHF